MKSPTLQIQGCLKACWRSCSSLLRLRLTTKTKGDPRLWSISCHNPEWGPLLLQLCYWTQQALWLVDVHLWIVRLSPIRKNNFEIIISRSWLSPGRWNYNKLKDVKSKPLLLRNASDFTVGLFAGWSRAGSSIAASISFLYSRLLMNRKETSQPTLRTNAISKGQASCL